MSDIAFAQIPQNLRNPGFFAEINNSQANTSQPGVQNVLIIGQGTTAGLAASGVAVGKPVLSLGPQDGAAKGGAGSMLDTMMQAYALNDPFGTVWFLPLADAGGAVAATGTLTITGPATGAGVLSLYIAGLKIQVPVTSGMTAAQVATAIAAAVALGQGTGPDGNLWNLPVTAAAAGAVVTFTAINAGAAGNDIDLEANFQGAAAAEITPPGLALAFVAMANGATNPTLSAALANLNIQAFDIIINPYTDNTSQAALTSLLAARWTWSAQIFGHVFSALRGTYGALQTAGAALNDPHLTLMGFYASPTLNYVWAAALAAQVAASVRADPALPVQTLPLLGVWSPAQPSLFSPPQQNALLYDGIATFNVVNGQVAIANGITTYQKNSLGQPDNSYLEVETMFTIMAVIRALASAVSSRFARKKLAATGTPTSPGSNIVTPQTIKSSLISIYNQLQAQGLVQDAAFFAQAVVVQINATNPNRVDVLFPPVLIGQLRIFALLFQFRLEAPPAATSGSASGALISA